MLPATACRSLGCAACRRISSKFGRSTTDPGSLARLDKESPAASWSAFGPANHTGEAAMLGEVLRVAPLAADSSVQECAANPPAWTASVRPASFYLRTCSAWRSEFSPRPEDLAPIQLRLSVTNQKCLVSAM